METCTREGVSVEEYLAEVRRLLAEVSTLAFDEATALTILHDLRCDATGQGSLRDL